MYAQGRRRTYLSSPAPQKYRTDPVSLRRTRLPLSESTCLGAWSGGDVNARCKSSTRSCQGKPALQSRLARGRPDWPPRVVVYSIFVHGLRGSSSVLFIDEYSRRQFSVFKAHIHNTVDRTTLLPHLPTDNSLLVESRYPSFGLHKGSAFTRARVLPRQLYPIHVDAVKFELALSIR